MRLELYSRKKSEPMGDKCNWNKISQEISKLKAIHAIKAKITQNSKAHERESV